MPIVDGVSGFLRMNGNPYFEALAAGEGTKSIKIYNKVNPFAINHGRLHSKYLIADKQLYNSWKKHIFIFLGSSSPYKNYGRDALVYSEIQMRIVLLTIFSLSFQGKV